MLAARRGISGRVYNIGTGRSTTITDLATVMSEVAGRPRQIVYEAPRPWEVRRSVGDVARSRSEIGFSAVGRPDPLRPAASLRAGGE
jgi:UDP-glucose 4-epimerase